MTDVGVEKFRTFEDARRALWLEAGDPRILERLRTLADLAGVLDGPRGVFRFRTIGEAKSRRQRATVSPVAEH
jgi:hypothetical protein